jgi:hypothetical protein
MIGNEITNHIYMFNIVIPMIKDTTTISSLLVFSFLVLLPGSFLINAVPTKTQHLISMLQPILNPGISFIDPLYLHKAESPYSEEYRLIPIISNGVIGDGGGPGG